MQKFANTLVQVTELRKMLEGQMKQAKSKAQAEEVRKAALERRNEIFEKAGYTAKEFDEMNTAVAKDAELQARVADELEQQR